MTNEQYSNMMIEFAKLEAKIENLQAAFSELLEAPVIENKLAVTGDIKPEHLSNFWNDGVSKDCNSASLSEGGDITITANSFNFTPHQVKPNIEVTLE